MSAWTDFRDKISSRKITLFEIDVPEIHTFFLPEEAGIWMLKIRDYRKGVACNFKNGAFCFGSFKGAVSNADLGWNDRAKTVGSVLVEGEAAQTNTHRWEDYTQTAIDPSDDCTIWYVGDYLKKGATNYSTRIGAFRLPGCSGVPGQNR